MKNIFGATVKQLDGCSWVVEVLNRRKETIEKKHFDNHKQAREFMDSKVQ